MVNRSIADMYNKIVMQMTSRNSNGACIKLKADIAEILKRIH
ncbi:MAG: hypothetical protein ACLUD4_00760 [Thomasclavelia spiroformis]